MNMDIFNAESDLLDIKLNSIKLLIGKLEDAVLYELENNVKCNLAGIHPVSQGNYVHYFDMNDNLLLTYFCSVDIVQDEVVVRYSITNNVTGNGIQIKGEIYGD